MQQVVRNMLMYVSTMSVSVLKWSFACFIKTNPEDIDVGDVTSVKAAGVGLY